MLDDLTPYEDAMLRLAETRVIAAAAGWGAVLRTDYDGEVEYTVAPIMAWRVRLSLSGADDLAPAHTIGADPIWFDTEMLYTSEAVSDAESKQKNVELVQVLGPDDEFDESESERLWNAQVAS